MVTNGNCFYCDICNKKNINRNCDCRQQYEKTINKKIKKATTKSSPMVTNGNEIQKDTKNQQKTTKNTKIINKNKLVNIAKNEINIKKKEKKITKKGKKNDKKNIKKHEYYCDTCNYYTSRMTDIKKHMRTKKHLEKFVEKSNLEFTCEKCNKTYKYKSGFSRHKYNCIEKDETVLLKKSELIEMIKNHGNITNNINNSINNTNNTNNTINTNNSNNMNIENLSINVYLNEHCKNALNMTDFVQKINLSLKDILKTKLLGYSGGVSNIIIKNMNELPQNERPVQCFEMKPLEYYVKENDEWQKNCKNELSNVINKITKKQVRELKKWCIENPDYMTNKQVEYLTMVKKLMGSYKDEEKEAETEAIINNVCKNNKVKLN